MEPSKLLVWIRMQQLRMMFSDKHQPFNYQNRGIEEALKMECALTTVCSRWVVYCLDEAEAGYCLEVCRVRRISKKKLRSGGLASYPKKGLPE